MKNKKIIKIISSILISALVLVILYYIVNPLIIGSFNKLRRNEISVAIAGIVLTLTYLLLVGVCCYISASLARKRNRSVSSWVFASFLLNVVAVFYLYRLPRLKNGGPK
jgi:hypothetical protein